MGLKEHVVIERKTENCIDLVFVLLKGGASNCPYLRAGGAAEGGYWSTVDCFNVCTLSVTQNVAQFQLLADLMINEM